MLHRLLEVECPLAGRGVEVELEDLAALAVVDLAVIVGVDDAGDDLMAAVGGDLHQDIVAVERVEAGVGIRLHQRRVEAEAARTVAAVVHVELAARMGVARIVAILAWQGVQIVVAGGQEILVDQDIAGGCRRPIAAAGRDLRHVVVDGDCEGGADSVAVGIHRECTELHRQIVLEAVAAWRFQQGLLQFEDEDPTGRIQSQIKDHIGRIAGIADDMIGINPVQHHRRRAVGQIDLVRRGVGEGHVTRARIGELEMAGLVGAEAGMDRARGADAAGVVAMGEGAVRVLVAARQVVLVDTEALFVEVRHVDILRHVIVDGDLDRAGLRVAIGVGNLDAEGDVDVVFGTQGRMAYRLQEIELPLADIGTGDVERQGEDRSLGALVARHPVIGIAGDDLLVADGRDVQQHVLAVIGVEVGIRALADAVEAETALAVAAKGDGDAAGRLGQAGIVTAGAVFVAVGQEFVLVDQGKAALGLRAVIVLVGHARDVVVDDDGDRQVGIIPVLVEGPAQEMQRDVVFHIGRPILLQSVLQGELPTAGAQCQLEHRRVIGGVDDFDEIAGRGQHLERVAFRGLDSGEGGIRDR